MSGPLELNRAHWDALAGVHGQDDYYDVEALVGGADSLSRHEDAAVREAVGDVDGLDVVHIQCHIGFDTISLARRGARVTGVDLSPASLAKAADFAARADIEADWVEADAADLPATLHGRFDLAYASIGVIGWIADIEAWMRCARAVLRPGGRLVLVEIHPLFGAFESIEPPKLDFPYAFAGPRRFDEDGSYADRDATVTATETVEYAHGLGEVVTAAVRAGLRVDALHEHLAADFDPRGTVLTREADGAYRLRLGGEPLPVLFTLLATA